jgi:flavorubredoxin
VITNTQSGTRIEEVAEGIYQIHTPVTLLPGGFSFNQYLLLDEEPLLFHTGPRRMFPLVAEAIASVMPLASLRWLGFSHFEADECGSLNEFLAAAPDASPLCSAVAAMVSVDDVADRPARALADDERISTGKRSLRWIDAPHLPHGWENGFLFDESSNTLLCGDLFTQPGADAPALTVSDILEASEAMRAGMDYYAHSRNSRPIFDKLAGLKPSTLACMHGSAWSGDGGALLRQLADRIEA